MPWIYWKGYGRRIQFETIIIIIFFPDNWENKTNKTASGLDFVTDFIPREQHGPRAVLSPLLFLSGAGDGRDSPGGQDSSCARVHLACFSGVPARPWPAPFNAHPAHEGKQALPRAAPLGSGWNQNYLILP